MTEIRPPAEAEALAERLGRLLAEAAAEAGHPFEHAPLALEARHDGAFAGGLAGALRFGWLCVQRLAVAPEARGLGIGSRLLAEAEAVARARGALGVQLDTFAFQAPRFYERRGYERIGLAPGRAAAEARHSLLKRFEPAEGPAP